MDAPKHAVITSFLIATKDRFHQYNPAKTLKELLRKLSLRRGICLIRQIASGKGLDSRKDFEYDSKGQASW